MYVHVCICNMHIRQARLAIEVYKQGNLIMSEDGLKPLVSVSNLYIDKGCGH